jgi:hypothetical protein
MQLDYLLPAYLTKVEVITSWKRLENPTKIRRKLTENYCQFNSRIFEIRPSFIPVDTKRTLFLLGGGQKFSEIEEKIMHCLCSVLIRNMLTL